MQSKDFENNNDNNESDKDIEQQQDFKSVKDIEIIEFEKSNSETCVR